MANELTSEQRQEILAALQQGNLILAIKTYREATGCGLKDAKDFIDDLMSQLHEQDPEAYPVRKSGCGVGALLCIAIGFGILFAAIN